MAKFVLTDAKVLYGGVDMSGFLSSVGLDVSIETPECTSFGDTSKRRLPGLIDVSATQNGYWDAATPDLAEFTSVGAASSIFSTSAESGTVGDIGYTFQSQKSSYTPGATIGEVFAFAGEFAGDGVLVRGQVMHNAAVASTANGAARQLGVSLATQSIYSALHVTAVSGTSPTLDVIVESDNATGFSSGVTRLTHPQMTAVGANWQSTAGAVTDDWWRLGFTIGGTDTPTFTVFGIVGIQTTLL